MKDIDPDNIAEWSFGLEREAHKAYEEWLQAFMPRPEPDPPGMQGG